MNESELFPIVSFSEPRNEQQKAAELHMKAMRRINKFDSMIRESRMRDNDGSPFMSRSERFEFENKTPEIAALSSKYYDDLAAWEAKADKFYTNRALSQCSVPHTSSDEEQLLEEAFCLVRDYLRERKALAAKCDSPDPVTTSTNRIRRVQHSL